MVDGVTGGDVGVAADATEPYRHLLVNSFGAHADDAVGGGLVLALGLRAVYAVFSSFANRNNIRSA